MIFLPEFKECEEYASNIFTTKTSNNSYGQKMTGLKDNCGHICHELIVGGVPVSGKSVSII